ncbi:transposase, Mutator family protein [Staphylococcus aureus subsp. aureus CIG1770]|nr:transposase, Mutator family protein [Staphylococcus aureus subsp. aureus CIG1770]
MAESFIIRKNYPYLMTDVLYIKVREENRVLSKRLSYSDWNNQRWRP